MKENRTGSHENGLNPRNWHRFTFCSTKDVTEMRLPRKKNCPEIFKCFICNFFLNILRLPTAEIFTFKVCDLFEVTIGVRLPYSSVHWHNNGVLRVNVNAWKFEEFLPRHTRWTTCDHIEVTSLYVTIMRLPTLILSL